MTHDLLLMRSVKTHASQEEFIATHARRVELPYRILRALEAAAVILLHYVRTGELLYTCSLD
jgi:hypothetical protein